MKLLPQQEKIIARILANPNERFIIYWPRKYGYTTFMRELKRRQNERNSTRV